MQIRPDRSWIDVGWSAIASALVMAVAGAVAVVASSVMLFPSLGPTAVMMAHSPRAPSSRPYNAIVGHLVGLGSAFLAVAIFGLAHAPSVFQVHTVGWARVGAAVLSIALGSAIELLLGAPHPPAASTTLLAALGSFHPTWHDTGLVCAGVAVAVATGDVVRQLRLRKFPPPERGSGAS